VSQLQKIQTGTIKRPYFLIVYGTSGVGKTTFAANAPNPIIIDIEKGSHTLDVARLTPVSIEEIVQALEELSTTKHKFETVVIDSLDHLEAMVNQETMKALGIDSMLSLPFGAAYDKAMGRWVPIVDAIKKIREKMNVILIAHSTVKKINDPTTPEGYDRFDINLREKAAAIFKQICDAILFATYQLDVVKSKTGDTAKAVGTGQRVLFTQGRPGHEGKNRFNLPYRLALSYSDFEKAATENLDVAAKLHRELIERSLGMKSEIAKSAAKKYADENKNDPVKLAAGLKRFIEIQEGK